MNKTLVTTALEATWPKKGPILFLGSWCCSYAKKRSMISLDYDIVDYHWDDRAKLLKDYSDLEIIYESYLIKMTDRLNSIHETNNSIRYWRILIGPWLYTVIHVLYDRWFMLKKAIKNENSIQVFVLESSEFFLVPDDMDCFNKAIESDDWNEALYSSLLQEFFAKETSIKFVKNNKNKNINKRDKVRIAKGIAIKAFNKISGVFSGRNDVFIIGSHLSFHRLLLLQLKLRQFPSFWYRKPINLEYDGRLDYQRKNKLSSKTDIITNFEAVLNSNLMKLIPKIYLEGFKSLSDPVHTKEWPKKPTAIFTSNSYASDDIFKCWAAIKVENGSKFVIGQHGGNFGMAKISSTEAHQIKISDKWLSWGWDNNNLKVVSVGNFKSSFKKVKYESSGDALLVLMTLPRYSYYLYSVPIAGQIAGYFNDQLKFVGSLPKHIRQKLLIRTYPIDRGWDQKKRFREQFNDLSFDESHQPLKTLFQNSRIFIGTYNATTYLEAFSCNMPSILFWDQNYWETDNITDIYFDKLRSVGVLHSSPISAANHLTKIWYNVDEWWLSTEVQQAINDFNARYTRQNPYILKSIKKYLK